MVALTAAILLSTASSHLSVQLSLKIFLKTWDIILDATGFDRPVCKSALNWLSWRGQMTDVEKVSVCRVQVAQWDHSQGGAFVTDWELNVAFSMQGLKVVV